MICVRKKTDNNAIIQGTTMSQHKDFQATCLKLIANGYRPIPVRAGEKRPGVNEWQTLHATSGMVRTWVREGFEHGNVGIITEHNPVIDLDIYDADMAEKMEAWCLSEFGDSPVRIGRAPKRLLMYTTAEPFTKMFTTYIDQRGTKHKVEVLGHGQQFVAYGIHPDTKQPFRWVSMDEPLDTPADMLPTLSADQARRMLAKYREFCEAAGWKLHETSEGRGMVAKGDVSDALLGLKPRLKLSRSEVEDALQYVDGAEEYERWVMVGMALHHQSQGHDAGLEMWKEWSAQAHNYDPDVCDEKWESFSTNPNRHTAVTFASVLKIAHEREKTEKTEEFNRVLNLLRTCNDPEEIFGSIAKQLAKSITADHQLDFVAKKMQDRVFEITEVRPRIDTVRKALVTAAKSKDDKSKSKGGIPEWCEGWVYLQLADKFFHLETSTPLTEKGFNAMFDRLCLSEDDRILGNATPGARASALALNVYEIPNVHSTVYLPGMDRLVEVNGRMRANTFDETTIPPAKAPETDEEHAAIATLQAHFDLILDDPVERNMVLDYLAYNVQHPMEKIVWAIVMQGAEGAGKTVLLTLMQRVLGSQNVSPLSATELADRYTGWAEGRKMRFIEEIRLHGSNRYEIIDKMKTFVSNEEVTVRPMHSPSYEIPNVTNYFMFTNHWDGMPFARMDRRYYVVATTFQTKEQLDEFNAKNRDYFADLYAAIRDHADVLRHWLLTRDLSPLFQPKRPALDTSAKHKMREISDGSEESDAISDVLEQSTAVDVCDKLLNSESLKAAMDNMGAMVPYGRAFNSMLTKAGFCFIGRFRLQHGGANVRWYTKHPHLFPKGREIEVVRAMLATPATVDAFEDMEDPFS
jgi:hypothetical protein